MGIFWMFVCGFQGDRWAWKNGHYESIADYKNKELVWDILGILATLYIGMKLIGYFMPSAGTFVLY